MVTATARDKGTSSFTVAVSRGISRLESEVMERDESLSH